MSILTRLFGDAAAEARAEAIRLGASVEEVERDVLTNGRKLLPHSCMRYSVPRRPDALPAKWAFLQRGKLAQPEYANGWEFAPDPREIPDSLRRQLDAIVKEWTEELLEFDADARSVSAYWEEYGGAEMGAQVVGYLKGLAEA